jgi:hypothetical protein
MGGEEEEEGLTMGLKASKRAYLQVLAPKVLARSDAKVGSPAGSST